MSKMLNMASQKSLPYKVDAEFNIINILKYRHEIPYHSRPFMWTRDKHIEFVVKDILSDFKKGDPHFLGIAILYTGSTIPSVSDAQHRLTICLLMILSLSNILQNDEPLKCISQYGDNTLLDNEPEQEDAEIMEKYEWTRFPNIQSCFEFDFEALGNLINKKEPNDSSESKIYSAYKVIHEILSENLVDTIEQKKFWNYINKDIRVLRICISDWNFSNKMFHCFNNIKVEVPTSYLLRNVFASIIGESRNKEIHDLFIEIQKMDKLNYEKNVHMMVSILIRKIMNQNEYQIRVNEIIDKNDKDIVEKFKKIFEDIKFLLGYLRENNFGKILKPLIHGHELLNVCLLPFGYMMLNENKKTFEKNMEKLLQMLICFAIRKGKVSFNPLRYLTPLTLIVNQMLSKEKTIDESLKIFRGYLLEWLEEKKDKNIFIEWMSKEKYEGKLFNQQARPILLYLVEKTDSLESKLIHEATDIDHIFAKKTGKDVLELENIENKHKLGNFTPFISQNKDNVRGNKSLGNKCFRDKIDFYKMSNIRITRKLAEDYCDSDFRDKQIEERTLQLAQILAEITEKELDLKNV